VIKIQELNTNYGIANKVEFVEGQGNFPLIKISNEYAEATISVYAGQVNRRHDVF
jgi:glucose-6-phosphate 1-epimerase